MKRFALILLTALFVGGLVGWLVARDPGYVLIAYDDMSLETSLWLGVFLLLSLYLLLRFTGFLWKRFLRSGPGLVDWNRERRAKGSRKQTVQGLLLAAEGRWPEAHKLLLAGTKDALLPLVNYLHAARSAQQLGAYQERDELLSRAQEITPGSKVALTLARVELQLEVGQHDQALAALLELQRETPRNPAVLRLLERCYVALGDAQATLELVPDLKKYKALGDAELEAVTREACLARLEAMAGADANQFDAVWGLVPKSMRHDPALVVAAADALVAQGRAEQAEHMVRDALGHGFSAELVECYGRLEADPGAQLSRVEGWLKDRSSDAALLLAAGRLALRTQQLDKAREYFEASLRGRHDDALYVELARVCLLLGDSERASDYLGRITSADGSAGQDEAGLSARH